MTCSSPARRGFTLVELIITVAIIAIVSAVMFVAVGELRAADLRAESSRLAGEMRYLYQLSVTNNLNYRLVIDLDAGKYWGEELTNQEDPCARYLGDDADPQAAFIDEAEQKKAAEDGPREVATYSRAEDPLLTERELPKGIAFTGVITSHHTSMQTGGKVAIHFFPVGYAERAYVWFGEATDDGSDDYVDVLTLELKPLLGHAEVHGGVLSESDFLRKEQ